jgi:hypothetical protein
MPRQNIIDVRREGQELQEGVFELRRFIEGRDYRDGRTGRLIGSIGQRFSDNRIFAAVDARFQDNINYSTLFVRE